MAPVHKNKKAKHNNDVDGQAQPTTSEGENSPSTNMSASDLLPVYFREKPISILVGPEQNQYFLHKAVLVANSPFFSAMLKDCWAGEKEQLELEQVSSEGLEVAVHWMYSGQLPKKMRDLTQDSRRCLHSTLIAYKAADVLMMNSLQDALILNEAVYLVGNNLNFIPLRLRHIYEKDLCHTKIYDFVLHGVVERVMKCSDITTEEIWGAHLEELEDNPRLLKDMLIYVKKWKDKPWTDYLKGDLSKFLVGEADK